MGNMMKNDDNLVEYVMYIGSSDDFSLVLTNNKTLLIAYSL